MQAQLDMFPSVAKWNELYSRSNTVKLNDLILSLKLSVIVSINDFRSCFGKIEDSISNSTSEQLKSEIIENENLVSIHIYVYNKSGELVLICGEHYDFLTAFEIALTNLGVTTKIDEYDLVILNKLVGLDFFNKKSECSVELDINSHARDMTTIEETLSYSDMYGQNCWHFENNDGSVIRKNIIEMGTMYDFGFTNGSSSSSYLDVDAESLLKRLDPASFLKLNSDKSLKNISNELSEFYKNRSNARSL